jgi:hypothetical protein
VPLRERKEEFKKPRWQRKRGQEEPNATLRLTWDRDRFYYSVDCHVPGRRLDPEDPTSLDRWSAIVDGLLAIADPTILSRHIPNNQSEEIVNSIAEIDRVLMRQPRIKWGDAEEVVVLVIGRAIQHGQTELAARDVREAIGEMPAGWGPQKLGVFMHSRLGLSKVRKSRYAGGAYLLPSKEALDARVEELRRGVVPKSNPAPQPEVATAGAGSVPRPCLDSGLVAVAGVPAGKADSALRTEPSPDSETGVSLLPHSSSINQRTLQRLAVATDYMFSDWVLQKIQAHFHAQGLTVRLVAVRLGLQVHFDPAPAGKRKRPVSLENCVVIGQLVQDRIVRAWRLWPHLRPGSMRPVPLDLATLEEALDAIDRLRAQAELITSDLAASPPNRKSILGTESDAPVATAESPLRSVVANGQPPLTLQERLESGEWDEEARDA